MESLPQLLLSILAPLLLICQSKFLASGFLFASHFISFLIGTLILGAPSGKVKGKENGKNARNLLQKP
jgi:hypothetical protein